MQQTFSKSRIIHEVQWSPHLLKATFLVLSLFLIFHSRWPVIFIILSLLLIVALLPYYKLLFGSLCLFLGIYWTNYLTTSLSYHGFVDCEANVIKLSSYGPIIIINGIKILVKTNQSFNIGDILKIRGEVIDVYDQTWLLTKYQLTLQRINFNYLHSLNVKNLLINANVTLAQAHHSFYISFKNYLQSYPLILWLLLGVKLKKYEFLYKIIMQLNVGHLFVVSGFHVTLMKKIIIKAMSFLKLNDFFALLLTLVIAWFWSYILNFNASILRATLLMTLQTINRILTKRKWHIINLWCGIFLGMFLLWPYQIFGLNFILTFMTSLTIYLTNALLSQKHFANNTNKILWIDYKWIHSAYKFCWPIINVYLITLPIIIFVNGNYNLLGFFTSLLLSPLIVVWQFCAIIFLWSPLILNFLTNLMENYCLFFNLFCLIIDVKNFNVDALIYIYTGIFSLIVFYEKFLKL